MIRGVLLDLDGTVYLGKTEVPGATAFIGLLKDEGIRTLFVTNRANRTPERICAQLREYGITCECEDILTSAQAAARHIGRGSVYYIGEEGLRQALEEQGLTITDDEPNYVVVGFDRTFNYEKLETACRCIRHGATFIATNPDNGLSTEHGITPGTGALVAAVAAGSGTEPLVIGKPQKRLFDIALGTTGLAAEEVIAVGDNLQTDIAAGASAGIRTALILTGLSKRADLERADVPPTWVVDNYNDLTAIVVAENRHPPDGN